jgi:hypothetical protein
MDEYVFAHTAMYMYANVLVNVVLRNKSVESVSRRAKERIHDYLCFSSRRHSRVCEDGQPLSTSGLHRHSNLVGGNPGGGSQSRNSSFNSARGITPIAAAGDASVGQTSRTASQAIRISPDVYAADLYGPCKNPTAP